MHLTIAMPNRIAAESELAWVAVTSGSDLIVSAWRLLDPDERATALGDMQRLHERDLAGEDS
jgi:hypothetical protein